MLTMSLRWKFCLYVALMSKFSLLVVAHCGNAAPLVCRAGVALSMGIYLLPSVLPSSKVCSFYTVNYSSCTVKTVNNFLTGFFMPVIIASQFLTNVNEMNITELLWWVYSHLCLGSEVRRLKAVYVTGKMGELSGIYKHRLFFLPVAGSLIKKENISSYKCILRQWQ